MSKAIPNDVVSALIEIADTLSDERNRLDDWERILQAQCTLAIVFHKYGLRHNVVEIIREHERVKGENEKLWARVAEMQETIRELSRAKVRA